AMASSFEEVCCAIKEAGRARLPRMVARHVAPFTRWRASDRLAPCPWTGHEAPFSRRLGGVGGGTARVGVLQAPRPWRRVEAQGPGDVREYERLECPGVSH